MANNLRQIAWQLMVISVACVSTVHQARAAEPNTLTPAELAEGWISLFDGETLFGWTNGGDANWSVHDGVISVSEGKQGLLCTNSDFSDYQLHVDFRCPADTDSGVFLRTPLVWKSTSRDCYEINIAPPSNSWSTGAIVSRQKATGSDVKPDQWNSFDITADGAHFVIKLNGQQVAEYTDPKPIPRGFIGLQRNKGTIEFRNVKLRPLGLKTIFNGKDLSGWKTPEGSKSLTSVTPEGWLNVKQGKGALETEDRYGDFVLQLDANNAKTSNSGLFFRSIPGQLLNGYECQIDNGYKNGDRAQPVDGGTGAIYRRQAARKVVADDGQWFCLTIVASGKHMATWVNGYQVTDVSDDRAANENPRNGSRTEAGTIQIQGHDAKSDISLRNLRAVELPAPK